jgi:hypothetical protein
MGESEIPDCPQGGKGGYCINMAKEGYFGATFLGGTHDIHPATILNVPYHFLMSAGTWAGEFIMRKNKFKYFKSTTAKG